MNVSEFAEKHGVKVTQFGRFKVYMIPEDATPPELPTGRPPKEAAKTAVKKAVNYPPLNAKRVVVGACPCTRVAVSALRFPRP